MSTTMSTSSSQRAALSTHEKECGKVKHTALPADQPPAVVHCTIVCRYEMGMGTTLRSGKSTGDFLPSSSSLTQLGQPPGLTKTVSQCVVHCCPPPPPRGNIEPRSEIPHDGWCSADKPTGHSVGAHVQTCPGYDSGSNPGLPQPDVKRRRGRPCLTLKKLIEEEVGLRDEELLSAMRDRVISWSDIVNGTSKIEDDLN
ncbi:hypothetical protein Bbelb_156280 [Branchiostoma belcheri]|nr:hypothetical protein Bbelb_156280 [Branchiostoma belcheri]